MYICSLHVYSVYYNFEDNLLKFGAREDNFENKNVYSIYVHVCLFLIQLSRK